MSEADLKPAADQSGDFSPEQKRYLEGFVAGAQIAKAAKSIAGAPPTGGTAAPAVEPSGPDAAAFNAQNRVLAAGKKLSDQEKFKREQHPFDGYARLKESAARNEAGEDALFRLDERMNLRVPNLLENTLQLKHLDAAAATEAG